MKYILIVPDGMADEPVEELGGKTPLEAAHTANMDYLAQNGFIGQVQPTPEGMQPSSDVANMAILGYDPRQYHTGRACIEAANLGINLADNEIAFRCNLTTVSEGKMADHSAGHITTKEAGVFIALLNKKLGNPDVRFYTGTGYRHILVLKAPDPKSLMSVAVTPPHDILGQEVNKFLPKGKGSALLLDLMQKSKDIFAGHEINKVRVDLKENPATQIWLWGQGTKPFLPPFKEKHGLKGGIISAVDLVNGIGRLAGLEVISVPGVTGYLDTNFTGKGEYALKFLKKNDFVYVHIEAPDEAGHKGDVNAKVEAIENIDKHIVGTILNHFGKHEDVRILLLPDHPTPVKARAHTRAPVPFVMYGRGIDPDGAETFSEKTAEEKGLKFGTAVALLEHFLKKHLSG